MTDLFRPRRSDPPAVLLLKAIFAADEKREVAEDEQAEKHAATTVASTS